MAPRGLDATLARPDVDALAESIRPVELRQADLIAMARGYTMTVDDRTNPDWLSVTFSRNHDLL